MMREESGARVHVRPVPPCLMWGSDSGVCCQKRMRGRMMKHRMEYLSTGGGVHARARGGQGVDTWMILWRAPAPDLTLGAWMWLTLRHDSEWPDSQASLRCSSLQYSATSQDSQIMVAGERQPARSQHLTKATDASCSDSNRKVWPFSASFLRRAIAHRSSLV